MMRPSLSRAIRRPDRGVALVIVLAFVLLLTGLVLAFFSRALSERQISNSSAGQVKVDLFTQGSVATIIGDLQQEIAAGSNATYYTDGGSGALLGSVYVPASPVTVVPAPALKGGQTIVTTFPANLIKRSAYQQNFFPGINDTNSSVYNTNTTVTVVKLPPTPGATPSPVTAPARPPSNRAASLSTTIAAQNGRSISPTRWNKALLLPKRSPLDSTDITPYFADPGNSASIPSLSASKVGFVPPDWILVARDGTNPGSLSLMASFSGIGAVNDASPSNKGYVTGRYAYSIYDEGGLLDANVAGYPTATGKYPSENPVPTPPLQVIPQAKSVLSYADLTIPIPSDAANPASNPQPNLLNDSQVNALVGWRNYASSKPGGTFPAYAPAPTASPTSSPVYSNFDISVLTNLNGFVGVSNAPLYNNQSDRMFSSRQELINFFTQGLPANSTDTYRLQNSLQYFGTFSRGLNQPSYTPVSRADPANPRPLIQPSTPTGSQPGGGNVVGDAYPTAAAQDAFNPNFLSVRVQKTVVADPNPAMNIGRDDGSNLMAGEPLVKSRFPLQRLAWLTCKGPTNLPATVRYQSSDADILALVNNYSITRDYLAKGTPAAIQASFGLTWDATKNCWRYNVHNRNGSTGAIRQLQEVANLQTREPDFFELLKASVDPAALAKASTSGPTAASAGVVNTTIPMNFQFARDISLDASVIQLGANIIDQFDVDGYPTRIIYNDGGPSGDREFRGVENLPYIYRVRFGGLKVREPSPLYSTAQTTPGSASTPELNSPSMITDPTTGKVLYKANPLIDTGVGILMATPDIWNPHDQNCSLPPSPLGPTSFQLVANSATPDSLAATSPSYSTVTTGGFVDTDQSKIYTYPFEDTSSDTAAGKGAYGPGQGGVTFSRTPLTTVGQAGTPMTNGYSNPLQVNPTNSSTLSFQVPDNTVFREPTMLGRPDPTGPSKLAMTITNPDATGLRGSSGAAVFTGGGFRTVTNLNPLGLHVIPSFTQPYCGIYLGVFPLRWVGGRWSGAPSPSTWVYTDVYIGTGGSPVAGITYSLQCKDASGNFVTYDEKYIDSDTSFEDPLSGGQVQSAGGAFSFVDPRTSRFGSPVETNIDKGSPNRWRVPFNANTPIPWLDSSESATVRGADAVVTERPGIETGFGVNFRGAPPNPAAFPPTNGDWGAWTAPGWHYFNVGPQPPSGNVNSIFFQGGLFAQNDPSFPNLGLRYPGDSTPIPGDPTFYSDADGVVRRGTAAYAASGSTIGQPLATSTASYSGGSGKGTANAQSQSRPIILNRPFRSVAELGCVFSGLPWKNVDFSTPESGYSALLDVFCVSDTTPSNGLVAGKVNMNTRQPAVLKSILTGAYTDEDNSLASKPTWSTAPLSATDADAISQLLVARTTLAPKAGPNTTNGPQQLQNLGDLVGRWNQKKTIIGTFTPALNLSHNVDGSQSYDGFSTDLGTLTAANLSSPQILKIPRLRESAVRALSNAGNTRVWNLMIDVIAQTGRYPSGANALKNFLVEGEERCWVHIAIDRYTGAVLDTKLEVVKE